MTAVSALQLFNCLQCSAQYSHVLYPDDNNLVWRAAQRTQFFICEQHFHSANCYSERSHSVGWQMAYCPLNESWEWLLLCDRTSQLFEMDIIIIPRHHSVALWLQWLGVDQKKCWYETLCSWKSEKENLAELFQSFCWSKIDQLPSNTMIEDRTCTMHMLSKNNNLI